MGALYGEYNKMYVKEVSEKKVTKTTSSEVRKLIVVASRSCNGCVTVQI
jgi:hypothetical protein